MYNNKLVRAYQMAPSYIPNSLARKPQEVRTSLGPVDREFANVETEGGETVYLPNKEGLPAHYRINGPRHYQGGVPMSIPPDSFIFSDTASMRIKDAELQGEFGMPLLKKGYTPAQIAKKYDINKYRKILVDPNSDMLQVSTAEQVIANFEVKLGKLALIQESMKGFPSGIPLVSLPYISKYQLDASQFLPTDLRQGVMNEGAMQQMPEAKYGGTRLRTFAGGGVTGQQNAAAFYTGNPQGQPVLNKRQQRRAKREMQQELLDQALMTLLQSEKEPEVKPDLSTGQFLKRDSNGNPYYVDGNGVRITKFDDAYYGKNNTPTDGDTKIIERNGKRYRVTVTKKKGTINTAKLKNSKAEAKDAGDIYEENGKYYEVQPYDTSKPIGATKSGSDRYTGDFDKDRDEATAIFNKLAQNGQAVFHPDPYTDGSGKQRPAGWELMASARNAMSTDEKEFLTDFMSIGAKKDQIGANNAPEFNVSLQHADKGFYGYTNPDFYEFRFWKARNMDKKAGDWDRLDAKEKTANRKNMFTALGFDVSNDPHISKTIEDPSKLYTEDFISGKTKSKNAALGEAGLADSIEKYFTKDEYRPGLENDSKLGLEHADAFSYDQGIKDITPAEEDKITEEELKGKAESPVYETGDKYSPWWLQDVIRTTGAARDLLSIKKYMPAKFQYNPYVPEPTYYDPSREIAALQETAGIAKNLIEGSGNKSAAFSARAAGIQGTAAEQIANVMGKYNTQNVSVANEFAYKAADIMNDAQVKNLASAQTYVDQVNTVNQNYDNAKRAGREQLRSAYIDAVTNRSQAQVLNELYPNYKIDPGRGGDLIFNKGTKMEPGKETANAATTSANAFMDWYSQYPDLSESSAVNLWNGINKKGAASTVEQDYMNNYMGVANFGQTQNPMGNYYQGAPEQKNGGVTLPFYYNVGY